MDGRGGLYLLEVVQQRLHRAFRDRLDLTGGRMVIAMLSRDQPERIRLDVARLDQPVQPGRDHDQSLLAAARCELAAKRCPAQLARRGLAPRDEVGGNVAQQLGKGNRIAHPELGRRHAWALVPQPDQKAADLARVDLACGLRVRPRRNPGLDRLLGRDLAQQAASQHRRRRH